jgi:selenocysteine-specific elongation factor
MIAAASMSASPQVKTVVVGTAGHIDHGKSSLVKSLTGTDPDRLKEEQERGLTIDLGYAEYLASDGTDVGLIDVPGHERFVRNMVAGATGIDVVMLVVAADDGVMPQTREHLEILQLLRISRGFVALTKTDLVDETTRELAEADVLSLVAGTFLEGAPVIPCSNQTGAGLDAIKAEIERQVREVPPRNPGAAFRMPVQRSFTVKGHGTVVTGIPLSGRVRPGDELELLPAGVRVRVRGLQVHHRSADLGSQGHRVAVNLSDVAWKDVHRGDVLASPGLFAPTTGVETRFRLLGSAKEPLESHAPVRFHAGCAEVLGRLVLIDRKTLLPGEDALAQVRLEEPVVVAPGDRFLVRQISAERTLGGGVVLGESRFREKQGKAWVASNLASKEESLGDSESYLAATVRGEGLRPVALDRLPQLVHQEKGLVAAAARALVQKGVFVELDGGRTVLHREAVEVGAAEVEKALLALHEKDHYAFGFGAAEIANLIRHDPSTIETFAERGVAKGLLEKQQGQYRAKAFKGGLSQEDRRLIGWVEEKLRATGLATPSAAEMAKELDKPEKRIMNLVTLLQAQGKAQVLGDNVVLHATAVREARDKVIRHCQETGELTSIFAKDLLGSTRKYVIPLLEHFDKIGLTVRRESVRKLKPGWENAR